MSGIALASPVYTLGTWQANVLDAHGTEWICENEEGWSSCPPVRATIEDRQSSDGAWSGPGYYGARVINLSGRCWSPTQVGMLRAKDRIKSSINPRTPVQLQVAEAHLTRVAMVRLADQITLTDLGANICQWSMTLTAPDPRRYSAEPLTVSTTLPTTLTAGRTFPLTFPMVYGGGGSSTSGSVFILQEGDYDLTGALITFLGPLVTPRVEHIQTGRNLTFDLSLNYGEALVVDLLARTALLNGSVNRAAYISAGSAWPMLVPGPNELAFRGTAGSAPPDVIPAPSPLMSVTASSAWT